MQHEKYMNCYDVSIYLQFILVQLFLQFIFWQNAAWSSFQG